MNPFIKSAAAWFAAVFILTASGIALTRTFVPPLATADLLRLDEQEATIRAIKSALPSVVSIVVNEEAPSETLDDQGNTISSSIKVRRGAGTGFLISDDGLILTNRHVVEAGAEGKSEYRVTLYSGQRYYASLIGKDPLNDFAVLKIYDTKLPHLEIGDSDKLQVGATVIAIGNALGRYDNSATKGIISGLGRSLEASDANGDAESLQNVIQTDAEINHGNSGGPLIDLSGKVVGVNVARDEGGGSLGFSIPINEAAPVISSARAYGYVIRARLGVRYIMVTPEMAEQQKLPRSYGALVSEGDKGEAALIPGSPAEKAGLQAGDIIFEIDGKTIDERRPLLSYINQFSPGKKLGLRIQRGNSIIVRQLTLDKYQ